MPAGGAARASVRAGTTRGAAGAPLAARGAGPAAAGASACTCPADAAATPAPGCGAAPPGAGPARPGAGTAGRAAAAGDRMEVRRAGADARRAAPLNGPVGVPDPVRTVHRDRSAAHKVLTDGAAYGPCFLYALSSDDVMALAALGPERGAPEMRPGIDTRVLFSLLPLSALANQVGVRSVQPAG